MTEHKPLGYAVELYFDRETEHRILAFRDSIYQLGLNPVLGKMGDRPHISLAVFTEVDKQQLITITSDFAKTQRGFNVQLDAVGMFATPSNVVYLAPTPTVQLLEIHQAFHHLLCKEKINSSHYYFIEKWMPHCTIEFELPDDQFDLAVSLCKKHFTTIRGQFVSLGLIAFRPIEYIAEFPLSLQEEK